MTKRSTITITIFLMIFVATSVHAENAWESRLTVSSGSASAKLILGQRAEATDGVDGLYDVPPMLTGELKAYLTGGGGSLWKDVRALDSGSKTWGLRVESAAKDTEVVIRWDPAMLPKDSTMYLVDPTDNKTTDMKLDNWYSYKNTGAREMRVEVSIR